MEEFFIRKNNFELDTSDWEFVTKNKPKNEDMENLIFAWNSTKFVNLMQL